MIACSTLAAAAMQWPDLQTQIRAIAVCRSVAAAAGAPLNPVAQTPSAGGLNAAALQPLLVPVLFQQALRGLSVANEGHVISEFILLIRSIYIACAVWQPSPVAQLQQLLPGCTAEQVAEVCSCAATFTCTRTITCEPPLSPAPEPSLACEMPVAPAMTVAMEGQKVSTIRAQIEATNLRVARLGEQGFTRQMFPSVQRFLSVRAVSRSPD